MNINVTINEVKNSEGKTQSLNITFSSTDYIKSPSNLQATLSVGGSLATNTTYTYYVTALNSNGETTPSSISITTDETNLTANLTWDVVVGATKYRVYRNNDGYVEVTTNSLTDDGTLTFSAGEAPTTNTASVTVSNQQTYNFTEPKDNVSDSERRKIVGELLISVVNTLRLDLAQAVGKTDQELGQTIVVM